MQKALLYLVIIFFSLNNYSCRRDVSSKSSTEVKQVKHPDWTSDASIYEVNIRQFTPEGTFAALEGHLPRIKELGIEIIWLMPIHPIGEKNRKGSLGSYYSVKDYYGINPEFGDSASFRSFVKRAHLEGLKVIIDWVANHSAWDNPLVTLHPEFYAKDSTGQMFAPFDWTDVVKFDFSVPPMREYMLEAMKYWVREFDIDGYRCDVAGEVPMDFWDNARVELDKIKPVFMLAEAEGPQFHSAFDMTYGWEFHHIMNNIYKGEATPTDIENYLKKNESLYPEDAYRMHFITNHDENTWAGTEFERLDKGVESFFALTTLIPGMPLVYSGQEAALQKRLEFFEKDPIDWGNYQMAPFYKTLLGLKSLNPALYNGKEGGSWKRITTDNDDKVFAILRKKGTQQVIGFFNLSSEEITLALKDDDLRGDFKELYGSGDIKVDEFTRVKLPAWSYKIIYN